MYLINSKELSQEQVFEEFSKKYPNSSKPTLVVALDRLGGVAILPTPKPLLEWNERAVRDGVEIDNKGNTVQKWKVVPMFSEYTTEEDVVVTVAEQEEELQAKLMQAKAKEAERAVQEHINAKCVELGYDSENSIAKYLVDGNAFYDECRQLSLWISDVWVYAHTVQSDVLAGTREMPTIEELIAELPIYEA